MESTPASGGGKSNTMWYVIGAIVVVLLIGGYFLRGAQGMAAKAVGAANGVNVQQNANGATTYTGAEGTVTVGGGSMPANWPSDAPGNYANAAITS